MHHGCLSGILASPYIGSIFLKDLYIRLSNLEKHPFYCRKISYPIHFSEIVKDQNPHKPEVRVYGRRWLGVAILILKARKTMTSQVRNRYEQYRNHVFATPNIQNIKLRVHQKYSVVPIDIYFNVAKATKIENCESLIDIGCGTGDFLIYLRRVCGFKGALYGADFSSGVFASTSTKQVVEGLNLNFATCEAELLCFPDECVDAVSMQHMLSYVPDINGACEEVKRVLKETGVAVASANSIHNYPHVQKYRELACDLLSWPKIEVNVDRFCSENMELLLSQVFPYVEVDLLEGSLRLPQDEFIIWFKAMMDNWHPLPTEVEREYILEHLVNKWLLHDLDSEGYIYEPKWVGIATCCLYS